MIQLIKIIFLMVLTFVFCIINSSCSNNNLKNVSVTRIQTHLANKDIIFFGNIWKLSDNNTHSLIIFLRQNGNIIYRSGYQLENSELFVFCTGGNCGLFKINNKKTLMQVIGTPIPSKQVFDFNKGNILLISFEKKTGFVFSQIKDTKGIATPFIEQIANKQNEGATLAEALVASYPEIKNFTKYTK